MSNILDYIRLTCYATPPIRASKGAAGFDLSSAYDYVIKGKGKEIVKTDLAIQLPEDCYGRLASRSSLAWRHHIAVGAGVIDADYRGNVCVIIFNHGSGNFVIKKGDRVAQLICEKVMYPCLREVELLTFTERGSNGFGST